MTEAEQAFEEWWENEWACPDSPKDELESSFLAGRESANREGVIDECIHVAKMAWAMTDCEIAGPTLEDIYKRLESLKTTEPSPAMSASSEQGEQWLPIDTAPRNGNEIQLLLDGKTVKGKWIQERSGSVVFGGFISNEVDEVFIDPTAWKPTAAKGEGEGR